MRAALLASIDMTAWILLIVRVLAIFTALLLGVMATVYIERKVIAVMQVRVGPNRAGPFGALQTLADGVKLLFKEGVTPAMADLPLYVLAPVAAMVPALLAFAVIPFGPGVTLFHHHVPFQLTDLSVGILWVLAMASVAVYGVMLAGWASGSNYPLLGSVRATAQMISYEVGMSLALIAVVMYAGTVTMSGIVATQAVHFGVPGLRWLPKWNIFIQFPAFVLYGIAAIAENNRPPFDLTEAETELVAGYQTEYSGMKFAFFYLAEYLHLVTLSAVATTLFLGGWHGPASQTFLPWLWPLLWFSVKVLGFIVAAVWVRATLPRMRYDKLMDLGWKVMIPVGLLWILITGAIIVLPGHVYSNIWAAVVIFLGTLAVLLVVGPLLTSPRSPAVEPSLADANGNGNGATA
jgi:NADH-quinone oxidoreductase subunit H